MSVATIEAGEPIRAADMLLVARQLDAALGLPPMVVYWLGSAHGDAAH